MLSTTSITKFWSKFDQNLRFCDFNQFLIINRAKIDQNDRNYSEFRARSTKFAIFRIFGTLVDALGRFFDTFRYFSENTKNGPKRSVDLFCILQGMSFYKDVFHDDPKTPKKDFWAMRSRYLRSSIWIRDVKAGPDYICKFFRSSGIVKLTYFDQNRARIQYHSYQIGPSQKN